jgi:hypothetical protein
MVMGGKEFSGHSGKPRGVEDYIKMDLRDISCWDKNI